MKKLKRILVLVVGITVLGCSPKELEIEPDCYCVHYVKYYEHLGDNSKYEPWVHTFSKINKDGVCEGSLDTVWLIGDESKGLQRGDLVVLSTLRKECD